MKKTLGSLMVAPPAANSAKPNVAVIKTTAAATIRDPKVFFMILSSFRTFYRV